ncbi:MAG: GNAT family N-acetyltransferase [Acidimicrobiales bacterium]
MAEISPAGTELRSDRLFLRPPHDGDLDALCNLFENAEVMRYIAEGEPWSAQRTVAVLQRMKRQWREDGFGMFLVERLDGGFLGEVGLLPWDPASWTPGIRAAIGAGAEIEIGWTFAREHWGRGYASEAASSVRDWAFKELGLPRLISLIQPENNASIRVAEKIGETFEQDIVIGGRPVRLYSFDAR